jgi:hypothetical protein
MDDDNPVKAPTDEAIGTMPPDPFVTVVSIRVPLEWVLWALGFYLGFKVAETIERHANG